MRFSYKIYRQGNDVLLAISDSAMIGRSLKNNETAIEISDFYSGNACGDKEAVELIKGATIVNALGRDVVGLMLRERMLDKSMVLEVAGVPHAQIITVE